ncbi:Protein GVQW1 [Plecturocebus cupreus]
MHKKTNERMKQRKHRYIEMKVHATGSSLEQAVRDHRPGLFSPSTTDIWLRESAWGGPTFCTTGCPAATLSPTHRMTVAPPLPETGFHHVGQAGLELLTSSDQPVSTSQSAGITGMSCGAWPKCQFSTGLHFCWRLPRKPNHCPLVFLKHFPDCFICLTGKCMAWVYACHFPPHTEFLRSNKEPGATSRDSDPRGTAATCNQQVENMDSEK